MPSLPVMKVATVGAPARLVPGVLVLVLVGGVFVLVLVGGVLVLVPGVLVLVRGIRGNHICWIHA